MGDLPNRAVAARIDAQGVAAAASGDADMTLQPLSELIHAPGVEVVGSVPNEVQFVSVFSAAIVAGTEQVDAAKRLSRFSRHHRPTRRSRITGWNACGDAAHPPTRR